MSEGVLVFSWTPQAVIATSDSATTNGALTHHHGQWRFTGCCWSLNASPYKYVTGALLSCSEISTSSVKAMLSR